MSELSEILVKPRRVSATYSTTTRVAIGDHHLPFLTLVYKGADTYFCLHEKTTLPNPVNLIGDGGNLGKNISYVKINNIILASCLEDAIKLNEEKGGAHLNPYSFITGYCLAKGYDLIDLGLFTL